MSADYASRHGLGLVLAHLRNDQEAVDAILDLYDLHGPELALLLTIVELAGFARSDMHAFREDVYSLATRAAVAQ